MWQNEVYFSHSPPCSPHTSFICVAVFGSHWSKEVNVNRYDVITFQLKLFLVTLILTGCPLLLALCQTKLSLVNDHLVVSHLNSLSLKYIYIDIDQTLNSNLDIRYFLQALFHLHKLLQVEIKPERNMTHLNLS